MKNELKYYTPLTMGFIILMIEMLVPPIGVIPTSALYGAGMFLILCAAVVGLDVPSILHELNEFKRLQIEEINNKKLD